MRALTVERYGDKAGVRAGEVPDPEVGADDVLVRIHSASVNPLDRMIRDGELKAILPYRLPVVLGNDLAGIVVEVGGAVMRRDKDRTARSPNSSRCTRTTWRSNRPR